jgi:hypothetical protein
MFSRLIPGILLFAGAAFAQQPCEGLPPGKHALLERFTEQFGLTCEQQLQIEPLLHAEESVSKPLLAFTAFTPEEQQAMMARIKLAARRQIRGLLTPDQQKEMDEEIESVKKSAAKPRKGGAKKAPPKVDPFENEEALTLAIQNYGALTPSEKMEMILQVKRAAHNLELTAEQQKKIEFDIQQLLKQQRQR